MTAFEHMAEPQGCAYRVACVKWLRWCDQQGADELMIIGTWAIYTTGGRFTRRVASLPPSELGRCAIHLGHRPRDSVPRIAAPLESFCTSTRSMCICMKHDRWFCDSIVRICHVCRAVYRAVLYTALEYFRADRARFVSLTRPRAHRESRRDGHRESRDTTAIAVGVRSRLRPPPPDRAALGGSWTGRTRSPARVAQPQGQAHVRRPTSHV